MPNLQFCLHTMALRLSFTMPSACAHLQSDLKAVKICAITTPTDAKLVASIAPRILPPQTELLMGMILWPKSRRSISISTAREISAVARGAGATPVAVFVDEDVNTILSVCEQCDVDTAQLHGPASRAAWADLSFDTCPSISWIDVRDVGADASISDATLSDSGLSSPLWTIFDSKGGGTGKTFNWSSFERPSCPWLLAGGLDPENVEDAVRTLRPMGLDVASGVAGPDKCTKDQSRLKLFLERAVESYSVLD